MVGRVDVMVLKNNPRTKDQTEEKGEAEWDFCAGCFQVLSLFLGITQTH